MIESSGLTRNREHRVELILLSSAFNRYMWTGNPEKLHEFIKKHDLPNEPMSLAEMMSEYFKKYNLDVKFNEKGEMTIKENG